MTHHRAVMMLVLAGILLSAIPSTAEERFGPWAYYAPYYFPPNIAGMGSCFSPMDFAPRYESPNPPQPSNAAPPCAVQPPQGAVKVSSRTIHAGPVGTRDDGDRSRSISTPYRPSETRETRPEASQGSGSRYASPQQGSASTRPEPQIKQYGTVERARSQAGPSDRFTSPQNAGELPSNNYAAPQRPAPAYNPQDRPVVRYNSPESAPRDSAAVSEKAGMPYESPQFPTTRTAEPQQPASRLEKPVVPSAEKDAKLSSSESPTPKRAWTWGRQGSQENDRPRMVPPRVPGTVGTADQQP